jgi:hypothetical protein
MKQATGIGADLCAKNVRAEWDESRHDGVRLYRRQMDRFDAFPLPTEIRSDGVPTAHCDTRR